MLRKLSFCLLSFASLAAFLGGAGGCNTNELAGHGDDDSVVGTEQDAKDTATAAENIAFRSFTAAFGSPGAALVTEDQSAIILETLKNAITATTRSSCAAGTVPNPSGDDVTINGGVSGSCAAKFDGDASDGRVRANCTNYDDGTDSGEAEVDGLVGALGSTTTVGNESTFHFTPITSNLLVITLANNSNCSALVNLDTDVTIDNTDGSGTVSVSGCVSICGEAFDVTGSDIF
jgi:hypothetical protein